MSTALAEPSSKLESEIAPVVEWANCLSVTTADEFSDAADRLKGIKALMKQVADTFSPMKKSADAAKKAILDQEKKHLIPLEQAESMAKRKMLAYQQEEQRKADEQRRKLQAEADEIARKEREAALKMAEKAKKPETKAKYEEQAAMVQAPVIQVPVEAPKVAGISVRKVWKARVINAAAVPDAYKIVDEKKLQQYATMMKEQAALPGVQFYSEEVMSAGSR